MATSPDRLITMDGSSFTIVDIEGLSLLSDFGNYYLVKPPERCEP